MAKYYIYYSRPISKKRFYKRDKTLDTWSDYRPECWQFTEEAAARIVQRRNAAADKNRMYKAHPEYKPEYGTEMA